MTRSPVSFAIDTEITGEEALLSLQARFSTRSEPATSFRSTYYDTFDWRVHRAAGTLAASPVDGGLILTWRSPRGTSALRIASSDVPPFAWDFPAGTFRDDLTEVIEMRRLMPVVTVETEGQTLRLLDAQDKTVARVVLQAAKAEDPAADHRLQHLPAMLHILPVRGYDAEHETVVRFVETGMGLARVETGELRLALAAIDRTPGDYSSKLRLKLDSDMRADEATKLVHRTLLATVEANREGTRRDLDSEFLHDFRVAVRRTRSALRQLKDVYPPDVVDEFSDEFRWLGQITGPTRDLDVYLLKMDGYRATLPSQVVKDLEPLVEFLRHRQHVEQRRLARSLDEKRYRALIRAWKEFLDRPVPKDGYSQSGRRPIREVASERIWKIYRRVRAGGRAIDTDTPPEALHRLRIECKKLRYLLEFFRSLYDRDEVERLIRALKRLQDNLGDFNDYEVQQENLRAFADQIIESGTVPVGTLMAMGRLVERLETGQAEERQRFAGRFGQFATKKNHARFRRLFRATRGTTRAEPEARAAEAAPAPEGPDTSLDKATGPTTLRRSQS